MEAPHIVVLKIMVNITWARGGNTYEKRVTRLTAAAAKKKIAKM